MAVRVAINGFGRIGQMFEDVIHDGEVHGRIRNARLLQRLRDDMKALGIPHCGHFSDRLDPR